MQLWMLGGAFALVGVPMIWLALRAFARDRAIAAWPRAPGVVTKTRLESWMKEYRDADGRDRTERRYLPIVEYTYKVAGQTLDGNRIHRNDDTALDQAPAQRTIDKYSPQQEVQVLYDPKDPKTSYLETRTSLGGVFLCVFGGLWIAIGMLLLGLSFL